MKKTNKLLISFLFVIGTSTTAFAHPSFSLNVSNGFLGFGIANNGFAYWGYDGYSPLLYDFRGAYTYIYPRFGNPYKRYYKRNFNYRHNHRHHARFNRHHHNHGGKYWKNHRNHNHGGKNWRNNRNNNRGGNQWRNNRNFRNDDRRDNRRPGRDRNGRNNNRR